MSASGPGAIRRNCGRTWYELVGPVEHETREADIQLKLQLPLKSAAAKGVASRIDRSKMQAIVIEPRIDPKGQPFFAKLRAEVDRGLLASGKGRLYLGFHLDPFHEAHWNNLTAPLSIKLTPPAGLKIDRLTAEAAKVEAVSDADPREFLLNVEAWPKGEPLRLTVTYFACVGEESCHAVRQEYEVHLRNDRDAGGARGEGAGLWDGKDFARRMLASDKNGDRLLDKEEVTGLVQPHFAHFDVNQDGLLEPQRIDGRCRLAEPSPPTGRAGFALAPDDCPGRPFLIPSIARAGTHRTSIDPAREAGPRRRA